MHVRNPVAARRRRRIPWGVYPALLPLFAVLGVFAYYPALSGVWMSFNDGVPAIGLTFVGLENYRTLLTDDVFWRSFANLGIIFVFNVTIGWLFPLLCAELLISLRSARLRFLFRTLLIAPMAFPGVVLVLLWSAMYQPNDGMINRLLESLGLGSLAQNWLGDPALALPALLFIGFPFVAGLPFLVFLTALQNISPEVFEATELDGCGRVWRFFLVDLPLMGSQVKLLVFLTTISVLQYGFVAYLTTGGGPDGATEVPVLRMLAEAFQGSEWGYAAALSTVLFVIALALSAVIFRVRRDDAGVRSL
ncbi:MAG: sugar ABC transporter permease [Propionibacteriaceae bacterium]